MSKKILFLEDLYNFYSSNYKRSVHYSAEKTGKPIVVQLRGEINFEVADRSKEGLTAVHLQSCHIDKNLNKFSIDREVMENALPSFQNRPILGYIHDVDGQPEFYTHNFHEENGEIVYDERPVGIIPESCNAKLVYDEEKDKTYVEVDGYLFDEYSKATEILEREGECNCSVEIFIRELSYNANDGYLDIGDFFFQGVTILGKTPEGNEVKPGMAGANVKLKDFNENNGMFADFASKIGELQERLNKLESACSDKQFSKEGGNLGEMKFEELLKKYNKTAEDIDFDYENMSEEELEQKFAELFEDDGDPDGEPDGESEEEQQEEQQDEQQDGQNDGQNDDQNQDPPQEVGEPPLAEEPSTDDGSEDDDAAYLQSHKKQNELQIKFGEREFALSLNDKIYALYDLVNATYADADNTWYSVNAYDNYVVMQDLWTGQYFKQSYSENDGVFSLVGDRIVVYAEFVTEDELKSLDEMRANYEALVQFKSEHEKKQFDLENEKDKVKLLANVNKTGRQSRYGNLFKR